MTKVLVYKNYQFNIKELKKVYLVSGKDLDGIKKGWGAAFHKANFSIDDVYEKCRKLVNERLGLSENN